MITLAGTPLLLEHVDGNLRAFLDQFQATTDLRQFAGLPAALRSPKLIGKGCTLGPGIAPITWPRDLSPRLNSYYWPTGATRWGYGFFLATGDAVATIMSSAATGAVTLQMGDEAGYVFSTSVYVLPPRPIFSWQIPGTSTTAAPTTPDPTTQLWLIPVVDERYWWQFIDADNLTVGNTTTWLQLISAINLRLAGVTANVLTVPDTIDSAYLQPDPVEFSRPFENVAVLIDAICSSLGRRLVRSLLTPGQLTLESAASSLTTFNNNATNETWTQAAGGDFNGTSDLPANVLVTFRNLNGGTNCVATYHTENTDVVVGTTPVPGARRVFQSSVYAYDGNTCRLQNLVDQLSSDVADWFQKRYDRTFSGTRKWEPCGYDNYIEWTFGRDLGDERVVAQTRVQSMPGDVFSETQLSQDPCALTTTTTTPAPTTTSTTSTTTTGYVFPSCTGQCKWVWQASGGYWYPASNTCSTTTTTPAPTTSSTTSSTTSTGGPTSTTSTTPDPCACPTTTSTTTTGGPTSTTSTTSTTTSSTTTTPNPCQCTYPLYCGATDGECTYTYCSSASQTAQSACPPPTTTPAPTTTTTPDPSTTTTTCDCNTTTTSTTTTAPGCGSCKWISAPSGAALVWVPTQLCNGGMGCQCSSPIDPPIGCGLCFEAACTTTTQPPPPPPYCNGGCTYWAIPGIGWYLSSFDCNYSDPLMNCYCDPPSIPPPAGGDPCDGNCPGPITVPCLSHTTTTSTTTAAPTTANPCANCYPTTTTTTSSTTTSTTTTPACGAGCIYKWNGSAWVSQSTSCNSGCYCQPPAIDGMDTCQTIKVPCISDSTTTSTTGTSTTTTTTTTPQPVCCIPYDSPVDPGACIPSSVFTEADCTQWNVTYGGSPATWVTSGGCDACTTTTTPAPTTTTAGTTLTPPTTTTTAPSCSGPCHVICTDQGGGTYAWVVEESTCFSPCSCNWDGLTSCDSSTVGTVVEGTCIPPTTTPPP